MTRFIALVLASGLAMPAAADQVTDTLQSAIDAYEDGDLQYALDELEAARQQLLDMKTDSLGAFLPPAPDGWSVEVNSEMAAGLAMLGGGVGAEATYKDPSGQSIKITLMADNPMVASVAAMISNAALMGMKVERINRQRFALQDDQFMALVGNRVLVQTNGDPESTRGLLEQIDYKAMAGFGS